MLPRSRTAKGTNKSIWEKIKLDLSLELRIAELRFASFKHIIQREQTLEKDMMVGRTRRRGSPATQWFNKIIMKKIRVDIYRLARSSYRLYVHQVAMA